jgi:S1-C subfamily serine protease
MNPEDEQPETTDGPTPDLPEAGWWLAAPPPEPAPPPGPPTGAAGPPVRPSPRPHTVLSAILAGLVLLSAGVGIGWGLTRGIESRSPQVAEGPIRAVPQPSSSSANLSLRQITEKVDPAIVDVVSVFDPTQIGTGSSTGGSTARRREGAGTGLILTSSGEVLTNNHVIEGSTTLKITIQGRSGTYNATVIGADPADDVALIQIAGVSGLPTVTLADSSNLKVGQRVVAIGNALGRGGAPTATEGTITALNQAITAGGGNSGPEHLTGLIETDAPISPGDSGGALVTSSGQVAGMITASARVGRFQTTSNQGYAIGINAALDVVNQIRSGHETSDIILGKSGFLGVEVQNLDQGTAAQLGLDVTSGALVVGVLSGTPAQRVGIPRNSVITAIDGLTIDSADALGPALHSRNPGERVRVTWVDGNGTHSATVSLIAGPAV